MPPAESKFQGALIPGNSNMIGSEQKAGVLESYPEEEEISPGIRVNQRV